MHKRILIAFIPLAALVGACSSPAASPTWTYGPSAEAPSPSPVAVASPSAAASAAPTATPSAPSTPALTGEVPITMTDTMRFEPASMTVKAGEPISFVVKNAGVIVHEFFVGSEAEQVEHAAEMAMGGMSHGHDNALSVPAGQTDTLTMTFDKAGVLQVGCHEPGHFEAGMVGTLTIVD
ncbi:MAG: cupredoxin domain-containing protein [Candidatus Limnocylindrales bacterium]